jgi:3-dehydroquinate synthase
MIPEGKGLYKGGKRKGVIIADRKLTIITEKVKKSLKLKGWEVDVIFVTANEGLKTLEKAGQLYGKLQKLGANRKTILFALGGGTIGDTVGFVAATYMRGLRWVGLPTTLLAQVDSSVGGKTGINLPQGKNLVGAFHQPILVLCDTGWLKTLHKRDLVSGLGEIIKYGLCFDRFFFLRIQKNWKNILNLKAQVISEAIYSSVKWKIRIVNQDIHDLTGLREKLNLGHTFAHALETMTDYKKFRHGEAVAYGLLFCAHISYQAKKISFAELETIRHLIQQLPLPKISKEISYQKVFAHMKRDKKNLDKNLRFILLDGIGNSKVSKTVKSTEVLLALNYVKGEK